MTTAREIACRICEDDAFLERMAQAMGEARAAGHPAAMVALFRREYPAATHAEVGEALDLAAEVMRLDMAEHGEDAPRSRP